MFVVDSTDVDRLGTAAEELGAMLNEEELRDAALLVFANKQDRTGAKGAGEISEALRLDHLRDRSWSIMACSAIDGRGINEGMDWLVVRRRFSCHSGHRWLTIPNYSKPCSKIRHRGFEHAVLGFTECSVVKRYFPCIFRRLIVHSTLRGLESDTYTVLPRTVVTSEFFVSSIGSND